MHAPTAGARKARALATLLTPVVITGALALVAPTAAHADSAPVDATNPATPTTVSADALPTVQIDGVAWSQAVVGNTVYVAGKFGHARPAGAAPGTSQTVRNNLLAYDIRTGALITSFAPSLNAQALTVTASPDGSRIYVGGDFTTANGQVRNRVAAYDTATGALVAGFKPSVSGQVRALAATNSTVYLGGSITAVGSVARNRLAAVTAGTGALLPWAPSPGVGPTSGNVLPVWQTYPVPARDAQGNIIMDPRNSQTSNDVQALLVTNGGSQVVAAGRFDSLNGTRSTGIGALDAVTGATRPFAVGQLVTNQGVNSAVWSLSTDGHAVYGTAYDFYGPGNLESAFAADQSGGTLLWASTCRGDTYSSFPMNGALYVATHMHQCENIGGALDADPEAFRYAAAFSTAATGTNGPFTFENANFADRPAPSVLPWWPTVTPGTFTGQNQGSWSVAGNGQYLTYGGEFPKINGIAQQGLVRYAMPSLAPNKMGPSGDGLTPSIASLSPGTARVTWRESFDQDNENLTYRIYRDNGTVPIYEVTRASSWWNRQQLAFTDRGLSAGSHTYRVSVLDPTGRPNTGPWTSVTVTAGATPARPYAETVRADGATDLWSLGERSGTTAYDGVGGSDLTVNGGVALGQPGAVTGDPDSAALFAGSSAGFAATQTPVFAPQTFSLEAWISTGTTAGGVIVSFGNANTGTSWKHDRLVYMDPSGHLDFGVWPTENRVVTSARAYNDGRWHHVVATMAPKSMVLYVDGMEVASRTDTSWAEPSNGYWRVGGDTAWSGAAFFAGSIDEVAVYPAPLSAAQVSNHYALGSSGKAIDTAPTASFAAVVSGLTASLDGSASTDPDGSIASWAWNFGDGATAPGAKATHTYAGSGTYAVTLTVTDDKGATATRTTSVTVTAPPPNSPPTAVFTAVATGRTGIFDASGSTDKDGSISGYAWSFGDGAAGSGVKATHDYPADGTYPVTLTVTDDKGATSSVTQKLVVDASVLASDTFNRSVDGGLGTADAGGPWTVTAGGTRQSVRPGAASFAFTPGTNTGSSLASVGQTSADIRTAVAFSGVPAGGPLELAVIGRQVSPTEQYRARMRVMPDASVRIGFVKLDGSATQVMIGSEIAVPGLTYTAGTVLHMHVVVDGTGTTALAATVWADGSPEPAAPTLTRTDGSAALQAAGSVGLTGYLSLQATAPVTARFTGFAAAPAH